MLAMAQGLDQSAGNTIQIMRKGNASSESRTISVSVADLFQHGKSELNLPIEAGDNIIVLQAESVFVIGEVVRPGEIVLRQGKGITVALAVAQGSGFTKEAKKKECTIVRMHQDGTREEIPVNLEKIMDGSIEDVPMMPNDILFVPASKVKTGILRALDSAITVVSGRLIYRF
jgi:polysaccharide export outer membrane protein